MPENSGFEEAVVDRLLNMFDPFVDGMAGQMGMPSGATRYSQRDVDEMWSFSPVPDPEQRAKQMADLYHQGVPIEDITDQMYPNRRKIIETGRPRVAEQIAFAKQQERRMARMARDEGHHIPDVEPWATITQDNAPPQETASGESSAPVPVAPAMPTPDLAAGVPPAPGWGEPGGQFNLTGPMS